MYMRDINVLIHVYYVSVSSATHLFYILYHYLFNETRANAKY